MAINLSNINISIRDFQAVSSGVINAGEVRLTSDHSIDKVNHHVGWFFSNNTFARRGARDQGRVRARPLAERR